MGERVSALERAERWCLMCEPNVRPGTEAFERLRASVAQSGSSFCDLCSESISPGSEHWTCPNGNKTIMHTNAFDMCDICFVRHCGNALPAPRRVELVEAVEPPPPLPSEPALS